MAKDPAFLFYTSDFLTGTMLMTDEQVGKYIRLLCLQHQKGRLSEKHMLSICKAYDEDIFEKFVKDSNGNYYNSRLEDESIKRSKFAQSRRDNAKGKKKTTKSTSKAYAQHMEDEDVNENINKGKDKNAKEIAKIYNDVCINLPKVQKLTKQRISSINARVKEYSLAQIGDVIQNAADSRFLNGENDRGWTADFDWIMTPTNFIKILENRYINKTTNGNKNDKFTEDLHRATANLTREYLSEMQ